MKKHLILPLLFALVTGIVPLKAGQIYTSKISGDEPTKAEALNTKASWIIILNSTNKDSLNFAISLCSQAIELDGNLAEAYFNRGDASYFLGNYSEALKDFNVAVEKRGDAYDHQFRGEVKAKLGDNEGALEDYKAAKEKGIANSESGAHLAMDDSNDLGIVFYNSENYTKAVEAFDVSVEVQENKSNLFNRANSEYLTGDKTAALQDWKKSGKMGNKEGKRSYKKFRK